MPSKPRPTPDFLSKLVRAALGKNARDCVGDMLQVVINALDSAGAVLWQATEGAKPQANPPEGCLFMLASAFPGLGSFGIPNLDFEYTVAGKTVRQNSSTILNDIPNNGGAHKNHPFLRKHHLDRTIVLPFLYKGGVAGAVSVYRTTDAPDFTQEDVAALAQIFEEAPSLLAAAQTRARQELLEKAGEIFKSLEDQTSSDSPADLWNEALNRLCEEIASLFHTAETSIILRASESSENFEVLATRAGEVYQERIKAQSWKENRSAVSFTEACLTLKRPVRIFDLSQPEAEIADLNRGGLPNFKWTSHGSLEVQAREALGPSYQGDSPPHLPPLSFLAVPIIGGQKLHGVIRCWIAKPPISYFSSPDQHLLELVADQLGRQCELRRRQETFVAEVTAWRKISGVFNKKLDYSNPGSRPMGKAHSIDEFSVGCLNLLQEVVKTADLNALWLLDPPTGMLQCVSAPWIHESPGTTENAIDKWSNYVTQRFALDSDAPVSKALREDIEQHMGRRKLAGIELAFPGVRQQVMLPLTTRDKKLGVLEVGTSGATPFPEHALHAARLIAAFLSHHLATRTAVSGQQAAEHARLETERMTNDAFRDIMHQMKGPLVEAARRINRIAEYFSPESPQRVAAEKAEALVKRSFLTARRVNIFGQLVRSNNLSAGRQYVDARHIMDELKDAWVSARLRANPKMRLIFNANFESLEAAIPRISMMDLELLRHAVHNILDNAVKYSYPEQEVRFDGGRSTSGNGWFLRVWNRGIPLRPNEIRHASKRGWRSAAAELTTGEGSGIGLWIVDKIMQALGGSLDLQPTRSDGYTIARLQFNPVLSVPKGSK